MEHVRRALDRLYTGAGVLAALCLISILVLIVMQMLVRWTIDLAKWTSDRFGGESALATNAGEFAKWSAELLPGTPAYVAYFMAAASFLAFAHALNRGAHIRVSIVLNSVGPTARRILEAWCFTIATAVMWYFVFYACRFVYWSWKFKDISQEQDKVLLWMPQSFMLLGAVILAICVTDNLLHVLLTGKHRIIRDTVDAHAE